jgi:hypothetical protein
MQRCLGPMHITLRASADRPAIVVDEDYEFLSDHNNQRRAAAVRIGLSRSVFVSRETYGSLIERPVGGCTNTEPGLVPRG